MNKYFILFYFLFFLTQDLSAIEMIGQAKVKDGDTIKINNEDIRLIGIDAFEIKQKCQRSNGTEYKCGELSKSALIEIISGQPVRCLKEKKGYYKRWLATCYVGKLDIGENMVLYGHAITYKENKKYIGSQNEAKRLKAGAWQGKFISPWDWRKKKKERKEIKKNYY
tara:strand:- start:407 stop:907 length:501 start_codon:yes stop_codon:yes gene_type:complete